MRRLKQLKDENSRLKQIFGDLSFERDAAGRHPSKTSRPNRKRKLAKEISEERDVASVQRP